MNWKELKQLADKKALFIESEPDVFMREVYSVEAEWKRIMMNLCDDLETEEGEIKNSKKNLLIVAGIDQAYMAFLGLMIYPLVSSMITRLYNVVKMNTTYYKTMLQFSDDFKKSGTSLNEFNTIRKAGEFKLGTFTEVETKVYNMIGFRLGVDEAGNLVKNGFIYNVYHNPALLDSTREAFYKGVVSRSPIKEFRTAITEEIIGLKQDVPGEGIPAGTGQLSKQYATLSDDVFAKVDRSATAIIQQDFELRYFIYGGTIIKTTRPFCRLKCNKVFNTEEAKKWPDERPAPISIDKDTYDAVVDMGGIHCRHSPLFISSELFEVLKDEGSDLIPA